MVANAVAALIVAQLSGEGLSTAIEALAGFGAPEGRGLTLRLGPSEQVQQCGGVEDVEPVGHAVGRDDLVPAVLEVPLEVVAETSDWRRVRGPDGVEAWAHKRGLDGKLTVKVNVTAHKFSGSARDKITAAGGSVTEVS